MADYYLPGDQKLSAAQIKALWLQQGGAPALADTMTAVALAESGGHTGVVNDNPSTGDYSVGLWQINYYGNLLLGRSHAYGTPAELAASPAAQAHAAISLAGNGSGLSNWSTYNSGAYKAHLPAATGASTTGGGAQTVSLAGNLANLSGIPGFGWLINSVTSGSSSLASLASLTAIAIKGALWVANPHNWARVMEVLGGAVTLYLGLRMLASSGAGPVAAIAAAPVRAVNATGGAVKKAAGAGAVAAAA